MKIMTAAQYSNVKAHLEAAGFTNLPAVETIDFTAETPATLNGNLITRVLLSTTSTTVLQPNAV